MSFEHSQLKALTNFQLGALLNYRYKECSKQVNFTLKTIVTKESLFQLRKKKRLGKNLETNLNKHTEFALNTEDIFKFVFNFVLSYPETFQTNFEFFDQLCN